MHTIDVPNDLPNWPKVFPVRHETMQNEKRDRLFAALILVAAAFLAVGYYGGC